jgi:hypothetical protein
MMLTPQGVSTFSSRGDQMKALDSVNKRGANRRKFLRTGSIGAGAVIGAALFSDRLAGAQANDSPLNKGDVAILTFLSALEQVEADLWTQYAELGGAVTQGPTFSPIDLPFVTGLAPNYITALQVLDGDMPQYIADNTDDEISHHRFLNNYLASKGANPIDLSAFAVLPPSQVTGVPQNGRLTNLKQLTVDTTWWTRYRSATANPDLGGTFENAVPDLAKGQHPAIPLSDPTSFSTPMEAFRTISRRLPIPRVSILLLLSRVGQACTPPWLRRRVVSRSCGFY